MTSSSVPGLTRFNAADDGAARAALSEVCASTAWVAEVLRGRPYPDVRALLAASDAAVRRLDEAGLDEALAGHPPIGRPTPGDTVSAGEQRGMTGAPPALAAEMRELNLAYQARFGHVFLVCASGLTAEELRDALRRRLGNSRERERDVARAELGRINRLRLTRLVEAAPSASAFTHAPASAPATVSTHVLDTAAGRPAAGVTVALTARTQGAWSALGAAETDGDGRCGGLPALPGDATHARLLFDVGPHLSRERAGGAAFFPEVTAVFAVTPGEHYHVPLLLSPFGYSVYRGS
ncbi:MULTISPECIES: 2-oxo-4-hydroxy-4-carboxy-5-ureidoimidazoline decarboxylase [Streptomyces]|uniref:2-oxo-4-hydroxy-4-carboxy-5-ureidoimidazoline decarboxylase n=1 Tax=Streptomyces TaxID=1883 RepID=UPI00163C87AF|nr:MULTISPECIES: 2-oxo-4-hydroxy-4-carboxy-5-ureidoimidazoline decarboxylase [Streptomyces]MBC2877623.1 2-oxo-4-hydroxy-4-carboxy-5-ureidoimidazoline decarboxylase [Streptomyces sp. TYQ1024]UBI36143.1 2-oxo-4-hydroxy-4-carboxy-5-ureidoimidazoline decarboxylase [Streptomyces mobaraensis]UKW28738.1 2-oxo-4-hydroxy-4-carboxy-5-ureidoimidazoline decarboxylase [Streptomyces sp. TYQ1024]